MNKQDIAIVGILVALLLGWIYYQNKQAGIRRAAFMKQQALIAATNNVPPAAMSARTNAPAFENDTTRSPVSMASETASATNSSQKSAELEDEEPESSLPAQIFTLKNKDCELSLSSKGAAIESSTLFGYRKTIDEDSGSYLFDFTNHPAIALQGLRGLGRQADYSLVSQTDTTAVFRAVSRTGLAVVRTISLLPDYKISVNDVIENTTNKPIVLPPHSISMGEIHRVEKTKMNMLSVDMLAGPNGKGKYGKVDHWGNGGRLLSILTGRRSGGCFGGGNQRAGDYPESGHMDVTSTRSWVALKSRFFAQIFSAPDNTGCRINVDRELGANVPLSIESVYGTMNFAGVEIAAGDQLARSYSLYIGPKKLSVIRHFGPKTGEIMEFGFWGWLCNLLVPILNFLYLVFRNYGVAIIILTLIIRGLFWPLTRKSNEGMKKMQLIQPKLKEIQTKFKSDPQKLQQEQMRLYREYKVNPLSSCLPMLVQIPIFIALFTILRSAVELRFASFLWIADLSEPENLLAGVIPFLPALNILPILMCVTMFLQSRLTPSMGGDASQQRMMTWLMPTIMLFMFYTMPSALLLYWTCSQFLAIIQLQWQKRKSRKEMAAQNTVIEGEIMTRQARRRAEREAK